MFKEYFLINNLNKFIRDELFNNKEKIDGKYIIYLNTIIVKAI